MLPENTRFPNSGSCASSSDPIQIVLAFPDHRPFNNTIPSSIFITKLMFLQIFPILTVYDSVAMVHLECWLLVSFGSDGGPYIVCHLQFCVHTVCPNTTPSQYHPDYNNSARTSTKQQQPYHILWVNETQQYR